MKQLYPIFFYSMLSIASSYGSEISFPETTGSDNGILIITAEKLKDAWLPFAHWKTSTGRPTKIITVSAIEQAYKGRDIQDKIRHCVLSHADSGKTQWVILGGDSSPHLPLVPDRDSKHSVFGGRINYNDIPSDSYYVSSKSWDTNQDGVYGEWTKDRDSLAYTHDNIFIGRIPVRVTEDVEAYTQKIISYESNYPSDHFADTLLYTGTVEASFPKLRTSWNEISTHWEGKGLHYFSNATPWDKEKPGDYALSTPNLIYKLNSKSYSKLHIHGHGFLPVWQLEGKHSFTAKNVREMTNKDAYLCLTTVSCFTGEFDSDLDPSITESMLRQPEAGAVIAITPSREGLPIFHDPANDLKKMVTEGKMDGTTSLMTSFWKNGLSSSAISAGEAFHLAKKEMTPDALIHSGYHWCLSELNFLGDPSIDLRPTPPHTPSLNIEAKENSLTLSSNIQQTATITIWQPGAFYQTKEINSGKELSFQLPENFKLNSPYSVSITGPNINAIVKNYSPAKNK